MSEQIVIVTGASRGIGAATVAAVRQTSYVNDDFVGVTGGAR